MVQPPLVFLASPRPRGRQPGLPPSRPRYLWNVGRIGVRGLVPPWTKRGWAINLQTPLSGPDPDPSSWVIHVRAGPVRGGRTDPAGRGSGEGRAHMHVRRNQKQLAHPPACDTLHTPNLASMLPCRLVTGRTPSPRPLLWSGRGGKPQGGNGWKLYHVTRQDSTTR